MRSGGMRGSVNLSDGRLRKIGSVQAVIIDQESERQYGAADRRRIGGIVTLRESDDDD